MTEFGWNKDVSRAKSGQVSSWCNKCRAKAASNRRALRRQDVEGATAAFERQAKQSAQWREDHPEIVKERQRGYYLKHKYGITPQQYEQMFKDQNGFCAIEGCERPAHSIDHDHSCCPRGQKGCGNCVRGLLCRECNVMLGLAEDNQARLKAAAEYLKKTSIKDVHSS